MGMLYAFDSLYVNGIGPKGFGLYRCKDTKGADQYDDVQLLKQFNGGGEHGPHGVALGPDNKIYVMNGNHTAVPEGSSRPRRCATIAKIFCCPANGTATATPPNLRQGLSFFLFFFFFFFFYYIIFKKKKNVQHMLKVYY